MEDSKWISVKKKLPKIESVTFNVHILVCTKTGDIKTASFGHYISAYGVSMTEAAFHANGSYHYKDGYITHWQKLPSPPKQ